jgi:hypothetical protein
MASLLARRAPRIPARVRSNIRSPQEQTARFVAHAIRGDCVTGDWQAGWRWMVGQRDATSPHLRRVLSTVRRVFSRIRETVKGRRGRASDRKRHPPVETVSRTGVSGEWRESCCAVIRSAVSPVVLVRCQMRSVFWPGDEEAGLVANQRMKNGCSERPDASCCHFAERTRRAAAPCESPGYVKPRSAYRRGASSSCVAGAPCTA